MYLLQVNYIKYNGQWQIKLKKAETYLINKPIFRYHNCLYAFRQLRSSDKLKAFKNCIQLVAAT